MRIRLPIGRTLLFLGSFFLALLALLPMRLGVDWFGLGTHGLAAREVQGSIWRGAFKEAQLGPAGLGDLGAGLHALPLLCSCSGMSDDVGRFFRQCTSQSPGSY